MCQHTAPNMARHRSTQPFFPHPVQKKHVPPGEPLTLGQNSPHCRHLNDLQDLRMVVTPADSSRPRLWKVMVHETIRFANRSTVHGKKERKTLHPAGFFRRGLILPQKHAYPTPSDESASCLSVDSCHVFLRLIVLFVATSSMAYRFTKHPLAKTPRRQQKTSRPLRPCDLASEFDFAFSRLPAGPSLFATVFLARERLRQSTTFASGKPQLMEVSCNIVLLQVYCERFGLPPNGPPNGPPNSLSLIVRNLRKLRPPRCCWGCSPRRNAEQRSCWLNTASTKTPFATAGLI